MLSPLLIKRLPSLLNIKSFYSWLPFRKKCAILTECCALKSRTSSQCDGALMTVPYANRSFVIWPNCMKFRPYISISEKRAERKLIKLSFKATSGFRQTGSYWYFLGLPYTMDLKHQSHTKAFQVRSFPKHFFFI